MTRDWRLIHRRHHFTPLTHGAVLEDSSASTSDADANDSDTSTGSSSGAPWSSSPQRKKGGSSRGSGKRLASEPATALRARAQSGSAPATGGPVAPTPPSSPPCTASEPTPDTSNLAGAPPIGLPETLLDVVYVTTNVSAIPACTQPHQRLVRYIAPQTVHVQTYE